MAIALVLIPVHGAAWANDNGTDNSPVTLTLRHVQQEYRTDEAANVSFTGIFTNQTRNPLLIAHPNACFPEDFQQKGGYWATERYGKAELLVHVLPPNGKQLTLRNNMLRVFPPDNDPVLELAPGESKEFQLAWFTPSSMGQWLLDSTVFAEPGTYRVRVSYRNLLPKAIYRTKDARAASQKRPWNGELLSNELKIVIQ